jgi:ribonuclease HI
VDAHKVGLRLYTDGSSDRNKFGGYAWAFYDGPLLMAYKSAGGYPVTNNQMELMGAISGLEALQIEGLEVWTDSLYLASGARKHIKKWRRNGWVTATNAPVKNVELWQRLAHLIDRYDPTWNWCKGHSGIIGNEFVDLLAGRRRKGIIAATPKEG